VDGYSYNNPHYHESLNNITPVNMYFGRARETLTGMEVIKRETLRKRYSYGLKGIVNFVKRQVSIPKETIQSKMD